jgi:hypothetical protein
MLLDWNCVWHQWYELLHQLGVAGQQQIVASFCVNGNHMCLSRIHLLRWCETMKGLYQDKVCGDWELFCFFYFQWHPAVENPGLTCSWHIKMTLDGSWHLSKENLLQRLLERYLFHSLGISLCSSFTQLLNSLCISWVASHQLEEGYYFGMYGAKSTTVDRLPTVQVLWSCMQKKQNVSVGISYLHHIQRRGSLY